MATSTDFNSVLYLIDHSIKPYYLNPTQEIILKEVWNGQTYSRIAQDYNYDPEYIKSVGCNLWKILSSAFNEPINKSNFVPFIRHKIGNSVSGDTNNGLIKNDSQLEPTPTSKYHCYWTTAPNVKHFIGREKELKLLNSWSDNQNCNCIVVSGMVGCGKTSLITKFSRAIKNKFEYVIWLSLENSLPITALIEKYLTIIDQDYKNTSNARSEQNLNSLLSLFINCLKEKKVLLILDNLESILKVGEESIYYKTKLENYGSFLRSVVSTNHQSLLVCASRVKPKLLEYYGVNQVKLLDLPGLAEPSVNKLITAKDRGVSNHEKLIYLSKKLHNNPRMLQIAIEHIDLFEEDVNDLQQIVEELSLLETVISLLEQELDCLSKLEKEMIFWLAISCNPVSQKQLANQSIHYNSKIKFANSVNSLEKRSLFAKHNSKLSLMPIMKSHIRRKLIIQAL